MERMRRERCAYRHWYRRNARPRLRVPPTPEPGAALAIVTVSTNSPERP
ncbi:hypothetical protein SAMN05216188_106323 [Lentzea xinjiangensis]|uniref:Uncharacterized protein n=1 Tax=Lentzea xinjiangensis TaxID=402600 RepID=A0A1H9K6G3_9PSEU|nr:hypothetical protein SAMN05216188_106323 [Lentzea xinjiangensis]